MNGRVAVVTGGTSGIGLEVVRGLAQRGARVVLVGRGSDRASHIAGDVARETGNPNIEAVGVDDLATRAGWTAVADEVLRRCPRLHVLVNNAGAVFLQRQTTADGLERTFALNVLAPLALTTLLFDRLRASAPARVVNITSAAHLGHSVDLADLQSERDYGGWEAYGRSKLELILLSRELARRFAGTGVTVNSVHPGFVRSGFGSNNAGGSSTMVRFAAAVFGRSLKSGARTPLRVAADPDLEHVSGEYFSDGRVATGSAASRDLRTARRLYEACLPIARVPEIPLPAALTSRGEAAVDQKPPPPAVGPPGVGLRGH
jgi:NAD(P)-dependent dehydrogenase (short-subunit alcohol dehydrogenase family)